MAPNLPPRQVLPPHPRHRLSAVTPRTLTRAVNSVIEPTVDVAADIAAINRSEAVRLGIEPAERLAAQDAWRAGQQRS